MIRNVRLAIARAAGVLAACLLALPCAPRAAAADDSGPSFSLDLDALFLLRDDLKSSALFKDTTPALPTIFDADDFNFDFEPGVQGRFAAWLGSFGVEARGFWVSSWSDEDSFEGTATCCFLDTSPVTNYGLGVGQFVEPHYESDLHGVDASLLYRLAPGADVLLGAKWLDLDEEIRFDAVGFIEVDTWNAWNRLIGPQIGARLELLELAGMEDSRFSVGLDVRTALLFNDVHTRGTIRNPGLSLEDSDDENQVSASVEGALQIGIELIEGVTLHAGYQVLWIHDAATAAGQIGGTSGPLPFVPFDLDTRFENVLYHGASVGLSIALP